MDGARLFQTFRPQTANIHHLSSVHVRMSNDGCTDRSRVQRDHCGSGRRRQRGRRLMTGDLFKIFVSLCIRRTPLHCDLVREDCEFELYAVLQCQPVKLTEC